MFGIWIYIFDIRGQFRNVEWSFQEDNYFIVGVMPLLPPDPDV